MQRILWIATIFLPLALFASDEKALLAAIQANPDEDTPRLMYADWLEEHGTTDGQRARAEFIRLQIKTCRATDRTSESYRQDVARTDELLKKHLREWSPPSLGLQTHTVGQDIPFVPSPDGRSNYTTWRRGFIEHLSLRGQVGKAFLSTLDELPALDALTLYPEGTTTPEDVRNFASLKWMGRIRTLAIQYAGTPLQVFAPLFPHMAMLERFHFSTGHTSPAEFYQFIQSPFAGQLHSLSLEAVSPHLATLFGPSNLRRLESLNLGEFFIGSTVAWNSPNALPSLRNLTIERAVSEQVLALANSPRFANLSRLDVKMYMPLSPSVLPLMAVNGTNLTHVVVDGAGGLLPLPPALQDRIAKNLARDCAALAEKLAE